MIRKATSADLDLLADLFERYRQFYQMPANPHNARLFIKERIDQKDSEIMVAELEDTLVGFVQLYPLFSSTRMKRLWLLNDLFVHAAFRGRGISRELIDASKELCIRTSACAVILETAKSNEIANQLYVATGFEKDSAHNYYEWANVS